MAKLLKYGMSRGQGPLLLTFKRNNCFLGKNVSQKCQCLHQNNRQFQSLHKSFHTSTVLNKVVPFYLSDIGEGIREVNVKEWFVKVGDTVEQFDNICEVQSDKASVTITSRFDGKITKLYHKVDGIAYVGKPLIDIDVKDDAAEDESSESSSSSDSSDDEKEIKREEDVKRTRALATPAVRRIAMQNNLDLSKVTPSGRDGRVLKEDVLKFLNISSEESNDVSKVNTSDKPIASQINVPKPVEMPTEKDRTVPVTGFTKAMVKTMTASLKIPHFVYSDEIDVTKLMAIRNSTKASVADLGVNLTFMPFFIKAASLALMKYPILNSSIDENCENITYKASHNIGIAMDTANGLAVPNIKNVQHKSILQIAAELNRLQQDGAKGSFKPEDIIGGTFSLSNIGIIGGTYTKPVILTPQVSIGALGKIQALPRFDKDGNVVKAQILCISWSADHRVIDGVTMAQFSNKWKFYIENPEHLLLNV